MYLKRLEIHGFKSFAKKTTLEFDAGITAIVGPNGAGKSNVADSIRWVLGEQSIRLMRGKKSDDVIFAGSDKKLRLGFAEVFATFDNRDRKIPFDASEVSIGRRIDRRGESEYLINNNRVRLMDVIDVVLKSGIGTSRYTVIGQGTIDQMIMAGPGEIKNLLDEASGVKNYYIKREKTLRRLEQTAQNLMRAEDLIGELEPRLKSLRRQAKRMEARAEMEQELKGHRRNYLGGQYLDLQQQLKELDTQLGGFNKKKDTLERDLKQARKNVESYGVDSRQELEKYREVQTELQKLQERKNQLLESLSMVRGKMQSHKTTGAGDAATIQIAAHDHEQKINAVRRELQQRENELIMLEDEARRIQARLQDVKRKLAAVYQSLASPIVADWPALQQRLADLENSFNLLFEQMARAQQVADLASYSEEVKKKLKEFKDIAAGAFKDPQKAQVQIHSQLQELLQKKEVLATEAKKGEISIARANVAKEFLQQQQAALEQEKLHLDLELKKAQSGTSGDFLESLLAEEQRISKDVEVLGQDIAKLEQAIQDFYQTENASRSKVAREEKFLRELQDELSAIKDEESGVLVQRAKISTQSEGLAAEINHALGGQALADIIARGVDADDAEALAGVDKANENLPAKIAKLERQLELIGGVDELTIQEYRETEARYTNLTAQVNDLKKSMQDLRQIIEELDEHIKITFNEAFHKVNAKFEEYFRMLFNGGRAYLSVLRAEEKSKQQEPEEGEETESDKDAGEQLRPEEKIVAKYEHGASSIVGIDMKATPPGKKLSAIQALSGGERALTSIALLCSLLSCFPSPFVVLDEVDAALDEANTIRFGQILGTLADQTQFITITHNRETMARSNTLYGVTMGDDGMSKLLSIKIEQAREYAK